MSVFKGGFVSKLNLDIQYNIKTEVSRVSYKIKKIIDEETL